MKIESHFRDPVRRNVTFRLRPTFDLRSPRDAHRYRRAIETRRVEPSITFCWKGDIR